MSLFLRAWKGHPPPPVPCFVSTTDRTETLVLSLRMPQPDANRPEENHCNDETTTDHKRSRNHVCILQRVRDEA